MAVPLRTPILRTTRRPLSQTLRGACCLVFLSGIALPKAFTPAGTQEHADAGAASRRMLLATGVVATALPVPSALAAQVFGLGPQKGPFERDAKDAVIVGDAKSKDAQDAKATIVALQNEAVAALKSLDDDPQTDLQGMVKRFGISELREATNTINNLMDENTAAGIQRFQRLMIQAKYQYEDEIPFPLSKKGVPQPRGEMRLARVKEALNSYIDNSKALLTFI